jgi:hypothetical protein
MNWFDAVRDIPLPEILGKIGLRYGRRQGFGPCPVCGATRRGHRDRRMPCGLRRDNKGWCCFACGTTGSGYDLVSLALTGQRGKGLNGKAVEVKSWYADNGFIEGAHDADWQVNIRYTPDPEPEPPPPEAEVLALLHSACAPRRATSEAKAWMRGRGYDPALLAAGVLTVPPSMGWPRWWPWGSRYGLIVSACTPDGKIASVHGRTMLHDPLLVGKTRWPLGHPSTDLLFADPTKARRILRGEVTSVRRVIVCEGITDYLSAEQALRNRDDTAIFGGTSGSWRGLAKVNWPAGLTFYVATDNDDAGNRYASEIGVAVAPRKCLRMRSFR